MGGARMNCRETLARTVAVGTAAALFSITSPAPAFAGDPWVLAVCGTTNTQTGAAVGSWAGAGASDQDAVDDMKASAPSDLDAAGPCFALSGLTQDSAIQSRDMTRQYLSTQKPGKVFEMITGRQPGPPLA